MNGLEIDPAVQKVGKLRHSILKREVLKMQLHDPLSQRMDPVVRVAVDRHVADVEVRADPRRLELVDVAREFDGALQEFIPDLLDANDDFQLRSQRDEL